MLRVASWSTMGNDSVLATYPVTIAVRKVELGDLGDRLQLVRALFEAQLLIGFTT